MRSNRRWVIGGSLSDRRACQRRMQRARPGRPGLFTRPRTRGGRSRSSARRSPRGCPAGGGEAGDHRGQERRLRAAAAVALGGLIGGVGLGEQQRRPGPRARRRPAGARSRSVTGPANENASPRSRVDRHEVGAARVAVQDAARPAPSSRRIRGAASWARSTWITSGLPTSARGADVRAEDALLQRRLRGPAVEAALADRERARRGDRLRDPLGEIAGELVGAELGHDLRVDPERAAHAARRVPRGERRPARASVRGRIAGDQHPDHPGGGRARRSSHRGRRRRPRHRGGSGCRSRRQARDHIVA